jgi:hypothetical protein
MAAITNKSGVNRVAPAAHATASGVSSIDDNQLQVPSQVVAFTTQAMILANAPSSTPAYAMIV